MRIFSSVIDGDDEVRKGFPLSTVDYFNIITYPQDLHSSPYGG